MRNIIRYAELLGAEEELDFLLSFSEELGRCVVCGDICLERTEMGTEHCPKHEAEAVEMEGDMS